MKKCIMIMNPESGKKKDKESIHKIYEKLYSYGYDVEIRYTKKRLDAKNIVSSLEDDVDLVISAGGDGTLNEVVSGNILRTNKLPLANLPLGTTNDVGSMYGLHGNIMNKLDQLMQGTMKKIDIIKINNTPFVYVACVGDYTDMAYKTPRELKKKYGRIAYIIYGLKQLRNKIHKYHIKYIVDGKEYEGVYSFIFVTNASRIAGVDGIYHDVKLNDNKFEVALAHVENKKDMLKMLVMVNTKDLKDIPGITYYQTDNFEVEFEGNIPHWCIDGEELKSDKKVFQFEVDKSTTMLMPKENLNKLFESE